MKPETYVKNMLKPPKSFFKWCESQFPIYEWKNKSQTIRSSERNNGKVISKRLTKATVLGTDYNFKTFAIIMVKPKRIEIQSYAYWQKIIKGKEFIEFELSNFEQFSRNKHIQVTKQYDQYYFGLSRNYSYMSGPYTGTTIYQNDWERNVEEISEMKYIDFSDFKIGRENIAHIYKYREQIEFLQKINSKTMALEAISGFGVDMRTLNQNWLRKNKHAIKNSEIAFYEYELNSRIKKRNGKVVPGIHKYMDYRDVKDIPKCVGVIRFQNWVIKNKVNMDYYRDYISLMKDLNISVDSDNVAVPKDLRAAHDNCVELLNKMERDIKLKEFKERKKAQEKMEMTIKGFTFIVPTEAVELINEGKSLSHCVGGSNYIEKHAKGETTIIFMRDELHPYESLYTIEYRDHMIKQFYGKHNSNPPADVTLIANEWKNEIERVRC